MQVLEIHDQVPEVVEAIIECMYRLDYTLPGEIAPENFHAAMYTACDYFQLPSTKSLVESKIRSLLLDSQVRSDPQRGFRMACTLYPLISRSDDHFRQYLLKNVNEDLKGMFDGSEASKKAFHNSPEFAYDLLAERAKRSDTELTYIEQKHQTKQRCDVCGQVWVVINNTHNDDLVPVVSGDGYFPPVRYAGVHGTDAVCPHCHRAAEPLTFNYNNHE